jgi:ribonuclease D
MKVRISKGQQTSNWENAILTKNQQSYAATDAWICLEMYNLLEERGFIYED